MPFAHVRERLERTWIPEENPHHSIIGLTGSGKSYLVRHGIMPLVQWDKVLIVDVKGDDRTLRGMGKPVRELPTITRRARTLFARPEPRDNWYRLTVHEDYHTGRHQIEQAFRTVWNEGEWIVVVDELRALCDSQVNMGYGHKGWWSRFMMRGRSKSIAMVNITQEPAWVPALFYTQPSYLWLGKVEDERAHKRISEVGASRALALELPKIRKRTFLYTDDLEDERFYARTGL